MSDDTTLPLSDVSPERARRENDMIDEQFAALEDQIAALEDEKAALEGDKEAAEERADKLEDVVEAYRDERQDELLASIRETMQSAAVSEDDFSFDFDDLADADIATLETVNEAVEATVEAAGVGTDRVSNRGESPDLSGVEGDGKQAAEQAQQAAQQAAADLGLGEKWQKLQAGEPLAERSSIDMGPSSTDEGDLTAALQELVNE